MNTKIGLSSRYVVFCNAQNNKRIGTASKLIPTAIRTNDFNKKTRREDGNDSTMVRLWFASLRPLTSFTFCK